MLLLGNDSFMLAADFEDYRNKSMRVMESYNDSELWNKKCLVNIAKSGVFAADRSINDYGKKIWDGEPLIR